MPREVMRRVEFVSFDHVRVLQLVVAWEACFLAMRRLCRRSSTPTVREHGASYCCSVINASWCTLAGAYLTRHLASMPDESAAHVDPDDPNSWAGVWVKQAARTRYRLPRSPPPRPPCRLAPPPPPRRRCRMYPSRASVRRPCVHSHTMTGA